MVRSVLLVLAGIAVLTLASFAIEAALNPLLLQAFPEALPGPEALASNPWVRALMFAYGLMCVATGGSIAAGVARQLPVTHASVMESFRQVSRLWQCCLRSGTMHHDCSGS